jgi:hypothetical protein
VHGLPCRPFELWQGPVGRKKTAMNTRMLARWLQWPIPQGT